MLPPPSALGKLLGPSLAAAAFGSRRALRAAAKAESSETNASLEDQLHRMRKEALTKVSADDASAWERERKALEEELTAVRAELRKLQAQLNEKAGSTSKSSQKSLLRRISA